MLTALVYVVVVGVVGAGIAWLTSRIAGSGRPQLAGIALIMFAVLGVWVGAALVSAICPEPHLLFEGGCP